MLVKTDYNLHSFHRLHICWFKFQLESCRVWHVQWRGCRVQLWLKGVTDSCSASFLLEQIWYCSTKFVLEQQLRILITGSITTVLAKMLPKGCHLFSKLQFPSAKHFYWRFSISLSIKTKSAAVKNSLKRHLRLVVCLIVGELLFYK